MKQLPMFTLTAVMAAMLAGCGDGESETSTTQQVSIQFDLQNNGSSVRCGEAITIDDGNTGNTGGKLVDTRFYVSNLQMIDAQGNKSTVTLEENTNQGAGVALLDFGYDVSGTCTTAYKTTITGNVARGDYSGVAMRIGVPVKGTDGVTNLNHSDTSASATPAPLQVTAMAWKWQAGRKFTKIEFAPTNLVTKADNSTATKWNVHVGSTGCSGDPIAGNETTCSNPNRLDLNFSRFDSTSQKVVLDVQKLFAESDLTKDEGGAVGCMSGATDPECPAIFKALGLGLTGDKAGQTLTGDTVQTVFTVQ